MINGHTMFRIKVQRKERKFLTENGRIFGTERDLNKGISEKKDTRWENNFNRNQRNQYWRRSLEVENKNVKHGDEKAERT